MGRSLLPSLLYQSLTKNYRFRRCTGRDRRKGRAVPVEDPTSSREARALKELDVCRRGGELVRYVEPKDAVKSFAGFAKVEKAELGRALQKQAVEDEGERALSRQDRYEDGEESFWEKNKWLIAGGGAAAVATAVGIYLWRRGRGGDDDGPTYHDDGTRITIKGAKKGVLEGWRAEVFRECAKGAPFSAIRMAVQKKHKDVDGVEVKGLLKTFVYKGWATTDLDERTGEDRYRVTVRKQGVVSADAKFTYKTTDDAIVLDDGRDPLPFRGWKKNIVKRLIAQPATLKQIRSQHPIDAKALKHFLGQLVDAGVAHFNKRGKSYSISAKAQPAPEPAPVTEPAPVAESAHVEPRGGVASRDAASEPERVSNSGLHEMDTTAGSIGQDNPDTVIAEYTSNAAVGRSLVAGFAQQDWERLIDAVMRQQWGDEYDLTADDVLNEHGITMDDLFAQAPVAEDGRPLNASNIYKILLDSENQWPSMGLADEIAMPVTLLWAIKESGWNQTGRQFQDYSAYYTRLAELSMGNRFENVMFEGRDQAFSRLVSTVEFQIPNGSIRDPWEGSLFPFYGEAVEANALIAHMSAYLEAIGAKLSVRLLKDLQPEDASVGIDAAAIIETLKMLPIKDELARRGDVAVDAVSAIRDAAVGLYQFQLAEVTQDRTLDLLTDAYRQFARAETRLGALGVMPNLVAYLEKVRDWTAEDIEKNGGTVPAPAAPTPAPTSTPANPKSPPVPQQDSLDVDPNTTLQDENAPTARFVAERAAANAEDPEATEYQLPEAQADLRDRAADPAATQGMSKGAIEDLARQTADPLNSQPLDREELMRRIAADDKKKGGDGEGEGGGGSPPPIPGGDGQAGGPPPIPGQSARVFDDRTPMAPAWRVNPGLVLPGQTTMGPAPLSQAGLMMIGRPLLR